MTNSPFLSGRELSRRMYEEAVRPIMQRHAAGLPYAAALIGPGSDVLGYDTPRSMDHDWGPRLTIFLADDSLDEWRERLDALFLDELPQRVAGFPTRFREFAEEPGIVHMVTETTGRTVMHRIRVTSLPTFLDETLGVPSIDELDAAAWLTIPEQTLLEVTSGAVFRDDSGNLTRVRAALAWYPDDIWRYRLAAAWKRISQIEPFIGRAGEVDDDLGSHVIAMSLVRDVMRLALMQERRYAPYAKWLGTAFASSEVSHSLTPHLDRARFAQLWQEREDGIVRAMAILATRQNDLALSEWIDPTPRPFFDRPFTVIDAERFADALTQAITDPTVLSMPSHLGGIDQFIDSTDALVNRELRMALRGWLRVQ